MRIALLVHAFPPRSRTGVEVYCESLARALAGQGHAVEVFAARRERDALHLAQEREVRDGYAVTWLTLSADLDDEAGRRCSPGAARALGRFLDRERPDVVHIQHLLGFGAAVIDEARSRDIPVIFTAHDGFAFSDEYTLIAPDLSPIDAHDSRALARCRLARGVLDSRLPAHDGYLVPGLAPPELLEELRAALTSSGPELEALAASIDRDLRTRLETLDRADQIEAPTRFIAQQLQQAGLRSPVQLRACGIDLADLKAPRTAREGPLRVLYLGGYFEHKGVHVLLEAAARCAPDVLLTLRGCAGSSDYFGHLQALARDAGARLGGPFERHELASLLADADLLALPSLWPENAPFVLREAFAAGCPVVVSDTPALRESVREGQDGRLLPAGDVSAWSAALQELAGDREALARLAAGVQAPRSIEVDAAELVELYTQCLASRRTAEERRRQRLPEHLRGFAEQHAALERLSIRELTSRAIEGLLQRARRANVALPELQGAESLLEGSQRLRERLAAARRAESWREEIAGDRERALASAELRARDLHERARREGQRADWQADLRGEREQRLTWLQEQVQAQARGLQALEQELQLARETCTELERRAAAGELGLETQARELEWRATGDRDREQELVWVRDQLENRDEHLSELQAQVAGAQEWRQQLDQLRGHHNRLSEELQALRGTYGNLVQDRRAAHEHQDFLETELQTELETRSQQDLEMSARLARIADELEWRTREMAAAQAEARSLFARVVGGRLRRRTQSWNDGEPGETPR